MAPLIDRVKPEVLVIDDVAEYYLTRTPWKTEGDDDRYYWRIERDFPNLAPPFPVFWMEFTLSARERAEARERYGRAGSTAYGCIFHGLDVRHPETVHLAHVQDLLVAFPSAGIPLGRVRWLLIGIPYMADRREVTGPCGEWAIGVQDDGQAVTLPDGQAGVVMVPPEIRGAPPDIGHEVIREQTIVNLQPCLLAISMLHCKNVEIVPHRPNRKLARAHQRRHGRPLTTFKTLRVEPIRRLLEEAGRQAGTNDLRRQLHVARGHFKDYRQGEGLFGKHQGLYWWEPQVRGTADLGVLRKQYAVGPGGSPHRLRGSHDRQPP